MEQEKLSFVKLLKKAIKLVLLMLYSTFVIVLSFGPVIAGLLTLLPAEASKANYLGYYSTCAFVPFSTIILFALGIIGFILLMKLWKYFLKKSKKSIVYLEKEALINQN